MPCSQKNHKLSRALRNCKHKVLGRIFYINFWREIFKCWKLWCSHTLHLMFFFFFLPCTFCSYLWKIYSESVVLTHVWLWERLHKVKEKGESWNLFRDFIVSYALFPYSGNAENIDNIGLFKNKIILR